MQKFSTHKGNLDLRLLHRGLTCASNTLPDSLVVMRKFPSMLPFRFRIITELSYSWVSPFFNIGCWPTTPGPATCTQKEGMSFKTGWLQLSSQESDILEWLRRFARINLSYQTSQIYTHYTSTCNHLLRSPCKVGYSPVAANQLHILHRALVCYCHLSNRN